MPQVLQYLGTKEYEIKISHSDGSPISLLFLGFGSIIRQNTFLLLPARLPPCPPAWVLGAIQLTGWRCSVWRVKPAQTTSRFEKLFSPCEPNPGMLVCFAGTLHADEAKYRLGITINRLLLLLRQRDVVLRLGSRTKLGLSYPNFHTPWKWFILLTANVRNKREDRNK